MGATTTYGLYADQQRNAFAWNITLDLRKRNVHLLFFNDFETRSIYSISSLIIFYPALGQNYAPVVVHWSGQLGPGSQRLSETPPFKI